MTDQGIIRNLRIGLCETDVRVCLLAKTLVQHQQKGWDNLSNDVKSKLLTEVTLHLAEQCGAFKDLSDFIGDMFDAAHEEMALLDQEVSEIPVGYRGRTVIGAGLLGCFLGKRRRS